MNKYIKKIIISSLVVLSLVLIPNANAQTVVSTNTDQITLNASVNPGGVATNAWFEYGTDSSLNYHETTPHVYIGNGTQEVPFSQKLTGLTSGVTYYYRAAINNGITTQKGEIYSFSAQNTVNNINTVNTNSVVNVSNTADTNYYQNTTTTNITATGAVLNAVFTNPGRYSSDGYFQWGSTKSFGNTTETVYLGSDYTSSFSGTLSNLSPNTTYYYRAVVIQNSKTYRGDTKSFTTYSTSYNTVKGSSVTTNAYAYTNPISTTDSVITGVQNCDNLTTENNYRLTANTLNTDFLPDTLFEWLLLLLILIAVVWALRRMISPAK